MLFSGGEDLLDKGIGETLDRLRGSGVDDIWWRSFLKRIEHSYIAPDFLLKPSLRDWLNEEQVQLDLKKIARAKIMGAEPGDEGGLARLRKSYEKNTGEDERLADGPIDVVVTVLVAGYIESIGREQAPVAGMVQEFYRRVDEGFSDIEDKLGAFGPGPYAIEILNDRVGNELARILKRRSLRPDLARAEISELAKRVRDGDLKHVDPSIQTEVLYWASRLQAIEAETHLEAKENRESLLRLKPNADTRVIDALFMESKGDTAGALQVLRDIDNPDGRTVLFLFLSRTRSHEAALKWFDEKERRYAQGFFTELGWSKFAVYLCQAGRWEEAVEKLAAVHELGSEWPELSLLEGAVNAAMLLPAELRWNALMSNFVPPENVIVQGVVASEFRARANDCLAQAEQLLVGIELDGHAQAAKKVRLWVRLTDPRPEVSEAARQELRDGLQDIRRAIDLLPFAFAFHISVDVLRTRQYLAQRESLGGLTDQELFAEFTLAEHSMAPQEFAAYLEHEEDRLSRIMVKSALMGKRIEALASDGQLARARRLLEEHRSDFATPHFDRIRLLVDVHEGIDPRDQLEKFYQDTGSIDDLKNLANHLGRVRDWTASRPLLEELFRREPTLDNAKRLLTCMQQGSPNDPRRMVAFLKDNKDLVDRDPSLRSLKAWTMFQMGALTEAKAINDALLQERSEPTDLVLDINLALQSGAWEQLSAIVEREWSRRSEHGPEILMRLASLASESDKTPRRAVELARLAASKASDDPQILLGAYILHVQLGCDDDSDPGWLARAAELSSGTGPVWKIDLRTVVEEMVPAHRERERKINESLLRGEVPLHFAANALNVPLSRILLDIPNRSAEQPDGRRLAVLPIISGRRSPIELKPEWTVGLDVTSIMVLAHLGLLRTTLDVFGRVLLAPETMLFLLNQQRSVRFHQPSRVKKAEEILRLMDEGRLKPAESPLEPPKWLCDEVGRDLAQLMELARVSDGHVVRPRPIFKLSTLMEKEAELGIYDKLVLPTTEFARMLLEKGNIDDETYERARKYLSAHDHSQEAIADTEVLNHPLYFDDLAVTYMQDAGLIRAASGSGINMHVHPTARAELGALIDANRKGEDLAAALDDIRGTLRDYLEKDRIGFLPLQRPDGAEGLDEGFFRIAPSLAQFLRDLGPCDAVCIDDRFLNKNRTIIDRNGRSAVLVCVLDLLHFFNARGIVDAKKKYEIVHQLRKGGFALVPVEADELETRLRAARDKEGHFTESNELRVLRQAMMRIRSMDVVQQPEETSFLDFLRIQSVLAIRRLWEDDTLPADQAVEMSDWLWRHVSPSPLDWGQTARERVGIMAPPEAFALHAALLLSPMSLVKSERHKAFRDWVETAVLEPLLPANARLVDGAVARIKAAIIVWSEKYGGDESDESSTG